MYFNSEKEGWITKQFLDEVIQCDTNEHTGHYLVIEGFVTNEDQGNKLMTLQDVLNYMWRCGYGLVCCSHLSNVNCQRLIFEIR